MLKVINNYQVEVPLVHLGNSEPLSIAEAEPGDVLAIRIISLSPEVAALGYATVLTLGQPTAWLAGKHGGYLLTAPLYPGTTLYLPVYLPAGGLMLGNPLANPQTKALSSHFYQVELAIAVHYDFPLQRPRLENDFSWFFLACHLQPHSALALAWQDLLAFLQVTYYYSRAQAKRLATPDIQACFHQNPTDPATTACLCLPKSNLQRRS